jgi:hypothetical protein
MNKTKISAEVVADSLDSRGNRLTSLLITFPRIILAEINTHRMLSKNTSSSRAIPFKKMVEAVQNNPFIPIAWQKHHSGMQGNEYHTGEGNVGDINYKARAERNWLRARDFAVEQAKHLYEDSLITKQLANRLLEPFMWTTMLITGSKEGWNNFFHLRCPQYIDITQENISYKSRKEFIDSFNERKLTGLPKKELDLKWLQINKGQAEIHMMALAEEIYDAMNESTPIQLKPGEWHIPFAIEIINLYIKNKGYVPETEIPVDEFIKISTAMSAHTSYTIVGGEAVKSYEKWIELHDKLIAYDPPHSSPMEHCARAMSDEEYESFRKGKHEVTLMDNTENQYWFIEDDSGEKGWCNNFKGFIPYRYFIDNKIEL